MSILHFEPLPKARSTAEHNARFQSDTGIPGTYVPNLSREHALLWRGKAIFATDDPRVEIRKKTRSGTQLLIVVRRDPATKFQLSMNGVVHFSSDEWKEFKLAIEEACEMLLRQRQHP